MTRIILFPFAVASIALLAVQVGVIIDFIGQRAAKRKSKWRAKFEANFQDRADEKADAEGNGVPKVSLVEEIDRLQVMAEREEWISMLFDLATSIFSLVVFWVVGAAIFSTTEEWAYGSALYFCACSPVPLGCGLTEGRLRLLLSVTPNPPELVLTVH